MRNRLVGIFLMSLTAVVCAFDEFDVAVCNATNGSKERLGCYKALKAINQCDIGSSEQQLTCYQKSLTSNAKNPIKKQDAPEKHVVTGIRPPLDLKIKGGNWSAIVSVDKDCIYTGQSDYGGFGPDYAHLSQVKLVIRVYPTVASLVCKDGSECMLTTLGFDPRSRGKNRLVPTNRNTVLVDYGIYPDSDIAIERKLGEVIKYCQSVKPDSKWNQRFEGLRGQNAK